MGGAARAAHERVAPAEPLPRTSLSDAELEYFRSLLVAKRQELIGAVSNMENEALRKTRTDAAGDLSMMPIHMADIGTDNYEQEFTLGLIANEREMLKEIDEALDRIAARTFGICLATHKPITKARLKVKPWARYCLEYKKSQEQNHRR
ncbi:MAG: transcriptional regulator [Planctomycetota bacterium]|nr:MAG: transcriptional regulator [Planctomycetota bacterium]